MDKQMANTDEILQIFISSTMTDLAPERMAVKEAIEELRLSPVLAQGTGAHPETPREVTLSLVRQSDIYIGLFWQRYGQIGSRGLSATEEEYQEALATGKPILIYIKEPAPNKDKLLVRYLHELEQYDQGHFRATFATVDELKNLVKRDIMREVSKLAKKTSVWEAAAKSQPANAKPGEKDNILQLDGVLGLLRERIVRRVAEQLDPSVKSFQTMATVEEGCKTLASKIRDDNFVPDVLLGWCDLNSQYRGSEIVSNMLARELGVPVRIARIEEIGERRQLVEDCQWLKGLTRVLIVDDACYSGSTLKAIQKKLNEVDSKVELRFAVLSTLDPHRLPNLYYVAIHNTEELLFPWGWSRLIVGFYDIYKLFGISDRRVVHHETTNWGSAETLAKDFIGNVRLLTVEASMNIPQQPGQDFDTFLYFLNGSAKINIADTSGTFYPGEYIFIPRGIGYVVSTKDKVQILELQSRGR